MTDPNAARTFRLRCSFIERDRLALLSHLEVAHTLERTVRRAGLPFAVSQGFSPHMKIAFGAALPVGVGSICEIFDVQLTEYVAPEIALRALRASSVSDLMVQECFYVEAKAKAASVAFPFSTYEVVFSQPVDRIETPETVTVVRKRKERVLAVSEFLADGFKIADDTATFTLEAKPTGSLRPDILLAHCDVSADIVSITRISQREML